MTLFLKECNLNSTTFNDETTQKTNRCVTYLLNDINHPIPMLGSSLKNVKYVCYGSLYLVKILQKYVLEVIQ